MDLQLPNEHFHKYFPEIAVSDELPDNARSCALKSDVYIVSRKILGKHTQQTMLLAHFQEACGLLLDMAACLIVKEEKSGQHYPDFAYMHPLFSAGMHIYSDFKVCFPCQRSCSSKSLPRLFAEDIERL